MKGFNWDLSNRWWLAMVLSIPVALAAALLMLFFPLTQAAQASQIPTVESLPASQETTGLSSSSVITIGVGTLLSDPDAFGWAEANSVQLAINETNAAGGINVGGTTYTLALVSADDGCNPAQAVTAANTLLNVGAIAVVGHGCSSASGAAQPIYYAAGVPMVSPSASAPQLTRQGYDTTFRTISHDGAAPTMLATYFRSRLRLPRSAVVEMPGYWHEVTEFYPNTFTTLGGTITSHRMVNSTSEFTQTLSAIQAESPNAIFYADPDPTRAGQFSRTARNLGMTNVIIGWSSFSNDEAVLTTYAGAAGAAAENDYAAMGWRRIQDMPGWTTFLATYQAANFPNVPDDPGMYGAFAYDAARIIIAAIDRADSINPTDIRNEIAATRDHRGVVGTYQGFDAYGDVIPQWAWLERYQNGQWGIVPPAKVFLPTIRRHPGP